MMFVRRFATKATREMVCRNRTFALDIEIFVTCTVLSRRDKLRFENSE